MRFALRLSTLLALGLLFAGAAAAQNYTATLDGLQEVPPVATPASGSALLSLDAAKMLTVHVDFGGLIGSVTASHIHCCAAPGVNAGVKYSMIPPRPPTSPIDIVVGPLTPADEADLNAGLMYVNIHTSFRPGGEIRGQIAGPVAVMPGTWSLVKSLYQ